MLAKLARLQRDNDMTLAEINPLARLPTAPSSPSTRTWRWRTRRSGGTARCSRESEIDPDEARELYEPSDFERNVKAIDAADHRGVIQGKDHGFEGNLGLVIGAGGGR